MGLLSSIENVAKSSWDVVKHAPGDVEHASASAWNDAVAEAKAAGRQLSDPNSLMSQLGHTALDTVGMVPMVGSMAEGANAGWYAAQGDYADAALSAAAAIPVAGEAADAARLTRDGVGLARDADTVVKDAHGAETIVKDVSTAAPVSGDVSATGSNIIDRVNELKDAIPDAQKGRITMAVGRAADSSGTERILVATSEPGGYLRPGVTVKPGEILAAGEKHAETDIANFAKKNGLTLHEVAATRPICGTCAAAIEEAGAEAVTALKAK